MAGHSCLIKFQFLVVWRGDRTGFLISFPGFFPARLCVCLCRLLPAFYTCVAHRSINPQRHAMTRANSKSMKVVLYLMSLSVIFVSTVMKQILTDLGSLWLTYVAHQKHSNSVYVQQ